MNAATNPSESAARRVPPRLAVPAKQSHALLVLGVMAVVAVGAVLFWFDPAQHRFYPFCFFHRLTGLQCPGCGSLRAMHQLLRGHVLVALQMNALFMISLPLLAWRWIRSEAARIKQQPAVRMISPAWLWLFLVVALVFTVLRNLPAFGWLAP